MDEGEGDTFDLDKLLKTVRKFRKKLRQIERLETIGRTLSPEESYKVSTKPLIREKLQQIILELDRRDESFNSTSEKIPEDDVKSTDKEEDDDSSLSVQSANPYQENIEVVLPDAVSPPAKKLLLGDVDSTELIEKETSHGSSDLLLDTPNAEDKKKEKQPNPCSVLRKQWKNKVFDVTSLEGHNDVVCDVDVSSGWLVSGSRDTSVKLWDLESSKELRNMSGHTGSVTCVAMLSEDQSNKLRHTVTSESNELMYDVRKKSLNRELMLLTASTDCSIKLWLIPQGFLLKSIYNFSPVVAMERCCSVVFAGSDTGKITAYCIATGSPLLDLMIHADAITTLKVESDTLMSASTDGILKLWNIKDSDGKRFNFDIADATIELDLKHQYEEERQILSACFSKGKIIFGDDGINIKSLDVERDTISKLPNHSACGFTDALCINSDLLVSTSYNIDTGAGSLNVRLCRDGLPHSYISSLSHNELPRLLCCAIVESSNALCFVSGGSKLLVWKENKSPQRKPSKATFKGDGCVQVKGRTIPDLTREPLSSDVESDATADEETDAGSWWWSKSTDNDSKSKKVPNENDSGSETSSSHSQDAATDQDNTSKWWCRVV